jgi:hypothetical protein
MLDEIAPHVVWHSSEGRSLPWLSVPKPLGIAEAVKQSINYARGPGDF